MGEINLEMVLRGLQGRGHPIEALVEAGRGRRLAAVRLTRSHQPASPVIDLLSASSEIEAKSLPTPTRPLPQLPIRVATTGHLIALKVLARDDVTVRRILVICEHSPSGRVAG